MAGIVLDGVTKVFGQDVVAVNDLSLDIGDGEFMVLVGPSGCGKSTVLRILAGLEEVTAGEVYIDGVQITDLPPKQRDVAMVFQNYALYPHMSVEQNLGFGLKLRKTPKPEIKRRVTEAAQILGLEPLLERKPAALSGGQRQRVAMGRAMVREPKAFLMDEPLSNLDAKLRVQMRAQLAKLHDTLKTTTVYVTHDQVEAMTLGQRVAVLRDGVLQQVDTPQTLYNRPANLFVAAFIGSPPMNLVEAAVAGGSVTFAGFEIRVPPDAGLAEYEGKSVVLGIRPSDLDDADVRSDPDLPTIEVAVDVTEELGSEVNVLFTVDAPPVAVEVVMQAVDEPVEEAAFLLEENRSIFCARPPLGRSRTVPLLRPGLGSGHRRRHGGGRHGLTADGELARLTHAIMKAAYTVPSGATATAGSHVFTFEPTDPVTEMGASKLRPRSVDRAKPIPRHPIQIS